jgi:hypothetical protein
MKKIISIILCMAVCLCVFASCGEKTQSASLEEIYSSLQSVANMPEMTVMPDELITTLFGFDTAMFEEYVFAEATAPDVNADVIIMAKVINESDIDSVCETLDGYLASVKDYTESYSPINFAKTANSKVCVAGNCVYLIITSEYFEAEQIVTNGLNG